MPVYEYECGACRHRFEKKQSFHDKPEAVCPKCEKIARRVFHPALVIFKGSGFYVTDHRKNGGSESAPEKKESKGESAAGKSKSESTGSKS